MVAAIRALRRALKTEQNDAFYYRRRAMGSDLEGRRRNLAAARRAEKRCREIREAIQVLTRPKVQPFIGPRRFPFPWSDP